MMSQVMIVDNEEHVRNGIQTLIEWDKYGIEIAAEASDGIEALELLKRINVDILITDIRMPEMDGLSLIEHVARDYPHIKCIVMSGFDEFSYAKKAIAYGVSEYLLKPSRTQEILNAVLKLTEVIESEKRLEHTLEQLRTGFRESFPLLKEDTLRRLITLDNPPYDRLLSILSLNKIEFPNLFYGVILLQIDNFHSLQQQFVPEHIELYKYSLKNIAEETVATEYHCVAFEQQDDIVLFLNTEEWIESESIIPLIQTLQRNLQQHLKFTVSIGLGSFGASASHLKNSYREATKALNNRFYNGIGKIVNYSETIDDDSDQTSYPLQQEKAILQAALQGEKEKLTDLLREFNVALKPESSSKDQILTSTNALVFALYRFCVEKNLNTAEIFGQDLIKMNRILAQSSLDRIQSLLYDMLLSISEKLNAKKNSNKLFHSALDYIQANFNKDISRETVAREMFITPGYLSLLFKQQLKLSFLEYLHHIRIKRACDHLRDRSLKLTDIAHSVGYQDEKYFFQVFKKYSGMTPSQYRNNFESSNM